MKLHTVLAGLVLLAACSGEKQEEETKQAVDKPAALTVNAAAKSAVTNQLNAYYQLKDALIEYDTAAANSAALSLGLAADSVNTDGISDSAMAKTVKNFSSSIASGAKALAAQADLVEKKRLFSTISENMYPLLQAIRYDESVIYHQMCPMAFNDSETAFWLSNNREIENPYLGKKHPRYSAGMLHCGEVKDSLAYGK